MAILLSRHFSSHLGCAKLFHSNYHGSRRIISCLGTVIFRGMGQVVMGSFQLTILMIYLWLHGHKGYLFVFHRPVFKKVVSAGLNSLQQGWQISVKNWIFDTPFHKQGPLLVILVPGMIQPSGLVNVLMKRGCWGHWCHWGCSGCWEHWGCRDSKARKISTWDFRVVQVLEFSFILMFWKNIFWG